MDVQLRNRDFGTMGDCRLCEHAQPWDIKEEKITVWRPCFGT